MSYSNVDRIIDEFTWLDEVTPEQIEKMTVDERIGLMWPMAVLGWARRGIDVTNQPFRRDVARLVRRMPDGSEAIVWQSEAAERLAASGAAK
jgi:hypothetical protein